MEMYNFVTPWFFNAPIEKLWQEIEDSQSWPLWLQDFRKVTLRSQEATQQAGALADVEDQGDLPYTFRFTVEITTLQPPKLMEFKSTGDLVGTGKWVLEPRDGGTAVTHYWNVGTTNPIFNFLVKLPFLRGLTDKNHNATMARAYQALKNRVEV